MNDGSAYDADYFLRGKSSGKSLYTDYRWLPGLTIPMCQAMVRHLGIVEGDKILDFGCARGYTVRAFREMGYDAWGYDISQWAIENADECAKKYLTGSSTLVDLSYFDWVIAKDVLEHVPDDILCDTVDAMMEAYKGVFAVVPLAHGDRYDVEEYEADVTHIHRKPLSWWVAKFHRAGWAVDGRYRVPGVKDNYAHHAMGNGFITARRIGG